MSEKKNNKKQKITKEELKFKEWKNYNKEVQNNNKSNENIMYHGEVKGKRWGW